MTLKGYLDTIEAKTGKKPADFRALAQKKGLTESRDLIAWLKADFGLGLGHARAIVHVLSLQDGPKLSQADQVSAHFAGKKDHWRKAYDTLMKKVSKFGPDVRVAPTKSYLSLLRGDKKFGVLAPATPERFDIGIKLKGVAPTGRLEAAGSWNNLVTHRVRIADAKEIDAEVLAWLKQAYAAA